MKLFSRMITTVCSLILPFWVFAGGVGGGTMVVKVTVREPVCTINNNQTTDINFGDDLVITEIDGVKYQKIIPIQLDCQQGYPVSIRLQFQGSSSNFNSGLLKTTNNDLGIQFRLKDGSELAINHWLDFTYPGTPEISAVLFKNPSLLPATGGFSSSVTLLMKML
ncbi:fimbrial protein [Pantoea sp. SO10]|uniref:fimbrial protein n=1 Tax=Pantoea sp. SO10 TaxID=2575375 RepID=UPI00143D9456|nr:fimbrial protein [Pantoea sp. SO10]